MAKVNITQVRSRIGATATQCRNLDALGLRRMGRMVQHEASATIMGMIERVKHLVTVEMNAAEIEKKAKPAAAETAAKVAPKAPAKATTAPKKVAAPKAEAKAAAPRKTATPKAEKAEGEKAPAKKATPKAEKAE